MMWSVSSFRRLRLIAVCALAAVTAPALAAAASTPALADWSMADLLMAALIAAAAPVSWVITRFIANLSARIGYDLDDARRIRLQDMVETGLERGFNLWRAEGADPVAVAVEHLKEHGEETIHALGGQVDDHDAMRRLVEARGAGQLKQVTR